MDGLAGQGSRRLARLLGLATTSPSGGAAADTPADPLDPARAVRRALADAGRKAFEVEAIFVADELTATDEAVSRFARLALGPHGETVLAISVANELVIGAACERRSERPGLTVAVLHVKDVTVALCLEDDGPRR